ncbi:hypothetical protein GIB67_038304 [Kingdonia uniflora]|uniref:Uncharacterized protein n=1 Tax=Kingdonia uniflora TaxID=39325 RepID=A0A7J7KUH7_9MAGN|nr:hypothetical protein GIB67_038304 [Kingdonia uniflora]
MDVYEPAPEFQLVSEDPLVHITHSSELWLIQMPINQNLTDGQEITLKLHHDGTLGSLTGSSGISYEIVSTKAQNPDATVFLSSASSQSKAVGKISRSVSLVYYPDPSELAEMVKKPKTGTASLSQRSGGISVKTQRSSGTRTTSARLGLPSQRNRFETGEASKSHKKRRVNEPTMSVGQSAQDSEAQSGRSGVSSLGSADKPIGESSKSHKKRHVTEQSNEDSD